MSESLETRRKRLIYLARHRGTQEADLLLGGFAERHLATLEEAELDRFEALLEESDAEIMDWIAGRAAAPFRYRGSLIDLLVKFKELLSTP